MAAVSDPPGASERSGRLLAGRGGGRSAETWKRHVVRQLKNRDLRQHTMFQDLIRFCTTDKYQFDVLIQLEAGWVRDEPHS